MPAAKKEDSSNRQLRIPAKPQIAPILKPSSAVDAYGFSGPQYELAIRRVGKTPEERFAWLVSFVQRPPEDFAEPYLLEVQEELFVFALLEGARGMPLTAGLEWLTQQRAIEIARRAQTAVHALSTDGEWKFDAPVAFRLKRRPDGSIADAPDQPKGIDLWIWAIKNVLTRSGDRLARCARPGCEKIFIRHNASLYCSSSCSNKVRNARRLHAVRS